MPLQISVTDPATVARAGRAIVATMAFAIAACAPAPISKSAESVPTFSRADGSYLLATDLGGTSYYCAVNVTAALDRAINAAARGGKRFERIDRFEIIEQSPGTRFVHLQLTATSTGAASTCSLAATLTFARLEEVEIDGQAHLRAIHSTPSTTFIEPQHTGDEAALAEELLTYLMVIDQLAATERYAILNP
jgi:hypothetical protein